MGSSAGGGPSGNALLILSEIDFGQLQLSRPRIFHHVLRIGGLRDRENRGPADQEPERHLSRRGVVLFGNSLQHAAAVGVIVRKVAVTERTVGGYCNGVALAPGKHGVFDRTLLQMIENLIASEAILAGNCATFS